jgi:hypothetical protein
MKKSLLIALSALALIAPLAPAAHADDVARRRATIDFEFVAGGRQFPAGTYVIRRLNGTASASYFLVIESADGKRRAVTLALPLPVTAKTAGSDLVFHKSGDRFYLTDVQLGGVTFYSAPPRSAARPLNR